jgi:hypothetical protein
MRTLFVTSVSIVTTIMLANLQKRVLETQISERKNAVKMDPSKTNIGLPSQKNGQMPIGNARFSDQGSPDSTLSFWQLDALKDNTHQL